MRPRAYYNENDRHAAAWLRELIRRDLIAAGDVDDRSIKDVQGSDLEGYTQCHFFAGIGGWSYALRLAGWPDDRSVWTGSCPCQPFSSAGKRKGDSDERHLWPEMFRLIRERNPVIVFGEQVEAAIRLGWLDGISADLERENYAVGSVVLGAHSVGAPHIRQRLFWVADSEYRRSTIEESREEFRTQSPRVDYGLEHSTSDGWQQRWAEPSGRCIAGGRGDGRLGNTNDSRSQGRIERVERSGELSAGPTGAWSNYDLIPCRDGKSRRIESGSFPLAHGVPARVVRLRSYGNAIVPQAAAEFITAFMQSREVA